MLSAIVRHRALENLYLNFVSEGTFEPFLEDRTQRYKFPKKTAQAGYSGFGPPSTVLGATDTITMAIAFKLKPKGIQSLPPGTHSDCNNLHLIVKRSGSRSYALRYFRQGKPEKMGLGSTRDTSFANPRDAAIDANWSRPRALARAARADEDGSRLIDVPQLGGAFASACFHSSQT